MKTLPQERKWFSCCLKKLLLRRNHYPAGWKKCTTRETTSSLIFLAQAPTMSELAIWLRLLEQIKRALLTQNLVESLHWDPNMSKYTGYYFISSRKPRLSCSQGLTICTFHSFSLYPTRHFTISEPQDLPTDVSKLHKIRFEALQNCSIVGRIIKLLNPVWHQKVALAADFDSQINLSRIGRETNRNYTAYIVQMQGVKGHATQEVIMVIIARVWVSKFPCIANKTHTQKEKGHRCCCCRAPLNSFSLPPPGLISWARRSSVQINNAGIYISTPHLPCPISCQYRLARSAGGAPVYFFSSSFFSRAIVKARPKWNFY